MFILDDKQSQVGGYTYDVDGIATPATPGNPDLHDKCEEKWDVIQGGADFSGGCQVMTMDICDQINDARDCGFVRCGIIESKLMTLAQLTAKFGLVFASGIYQEISKVQSEIVAECILRCDLAYNLEIMSETAAQVLANRFLSCFDEENTQYYTNGDYYADSSSHEWNPATTATFDTGILVINKSRAGCLWVEDED